MCEGRSGRVPRADFDSGDPERKARNGEIIAHLYRYRYVRVDWWTALRLSALRCRVAGVTTEARRNARIVAALARTAPSIAARGWQPVRRCG